MLVSREVSMTTFLERVEIGWKESKTYYYVEDDVDKKWGVGLQVQVDYGNLLKK